eukprot:tig00001366_g8395.t1
MTAFVVPSPLGRAGCRLSGTGAPRISSAAVRRATSAAQPVTCAASDAQPGQSATRFEGASRTFCASALAAVLALNLGDSSSALAAETRMFRNDASGYSLQLPTEWECTRNGIDQPGVEALCRKPDTNDEENLVITSSPTEFKDILDVGYADEVGERLIKLYDRPGTMRSAKMLIARHLKAADSPDGKDYYCFEYEVLVPIKPSAGKLPWVGGDAAQPTEDAVNVVKRHYLSKVALNDGRLVTITVQAEQPLFEQDAEALTKILDSFSVAPQAAS